MCAHTTLRWTTTRSLFGAGVRAEVLLATSSGAVLVLHQEQNDWSHQTRHLEEIVKSTL